MDRFDHAHLKELAALYTSGFAPAKPAALPSKHLPTHAMKRWVSLEFRRRLNAWEREVLLPFKGAQFSTKHSLFFNTSDKCQTQHDIGNNTIPLYVRVSFYISSFQTLPTHPKYFRPTPQRSYKDIRNPYTQAIAAAYDFLETIRSQTPEYCAFMKKTNPSQPYPADHLHILPLWLSFLDYKEIIPTNKNQRFQCKTPGCTKEYKQLSGLQYHNTKGKCGLSWEDYGKPELRATKGSLTCPFIPCLKSFTSSNVMDFHITKYYLQKWYFGQGEFVKYSYSCPKCPFATQESDTLRYHLLNSHPSPCHKTLE
ncbi:hypothetical protein DSO57_1024096 [Entomophthora muscae]|uniref:Uncharacterized protein n=1 Tax=Entomophthora muscae TaxID=34485 RepID=A0ACC2SFH9_9FUNG|nr:hypothetical protein DSO57_1024096 [Entomophthora muscae]